jgi:hypothetical protein
VDQHSPNEASSKEKAEGDRRGGNERVSEIVRDERDERDRAADKMRKGGTGPREKR